MALTVLQGALRACCQKKNVLIRIFAVVLLLLLFQKLRPVSSMHSVDSKLKSEDRLNCREQVKAEVGKSVVLPCIAEPQQDLRMVHWKKGNERVCLHRTTSTDPKVHPDYKGRAFLFNNNFTSGNCSMKLSEVKQSDNGTYTCIVSFIKSNTQRNVKECSVTLLVTSPPHSTTPSHHGAEDKLSGQQDWKPMWIVIGIAIVGAGIAVAVFCLFKCNHRGVERTEVPVSQSSDRTRARSCWTCLR